MQKKEKAYRTKQKLSEALIVRLREKPLSRIRVHELTDYCDLNRQTFYYHFPDIYALFSWSIPHMLDQLALQLPRSAAWQQQLQCLLEYAAENRSFFLEALDDRFYEETRACMEERVKKYLEGGKLRESFDGEPDSEGNRPLPSTYGAAVFFSILEQWLRREQRSDPETLIAFFEKLMKDRLVNGTLAAVGGAGDSIDG